MEVVAVKAGDGLTGTIKRGMSPGLAGIHNELYYMEKTIMLFGDAKVFVASIVKELRALVHH